MNLSYLIPIVCLFSIVLSLLGRFFLNQRLYKENYKVAKALGWSYNNFILDDHFSQYAFFQYQDDFGLRKCFTGVYVGLPFTLMEARHLAVEFKIPQGKFYGVEVFTRNFAEFIFRQSYSKFQVKRIKMESIEFNNIFNVYNLTSGDAYYDLAPDSMVSLIDLSKNFEVLAVEAKKDSVLIYGVYPPYFNMGKSKADFIQKKQKVLIDFLSVSKRIADTLSR
jgi:Protein of unknown function (DUF3137)